jgi:hypothetical protein
MSWLRKPTAERPFHEAGQALGLQNAEAFL